MQPAERDARYGPDDGAYIAAVEDWQAGDVPCAPRVLLAPADARVEPFALGASIALVLDAYSRLRWGYGSEGALHSSGLMEGVARGATARWAQATPIERRCQINCWVRCARCQARLC